MLQPVSPVDRIHGLFLTGGGVLALPASGGVLRFFEERKVGFDWGTPDLRIPIVVSAVIDDLAVGDPRIRPDADAAYKACAAATAGPVAEGNIGCGAGATIGKMHRSRGYSGMKGGLGTVSVRSRRRHHRRAGGGERGRRRPRLADGPDHRRCARVESPSCRQRRV